MTKVVHYSSKAVPLSRKAILKNMAVSSDMVEAAQKAIALPYPLNQEYGITNEDMAKAIKAALRQAARTAKT